MKTQKSNKAQLTQLLSLASRLYPSLMGSINPYCSGCIKLGEDNQQALNALHDHWRNTYPEAGTPYWSARSWTMLIWQPLYLAVISVHSMNILPILSSLNQKLSQGVVAGFCLTETDIETGSQTELIKRAGSELRLFCDALLAQLNQITQIRPRIAMRLAADSLLSALSELHRLNTSLTVTEMQYLSQTWLEAMDLSNASTLMSIHLSDGRERLGLKRKACCFYYLCHDSELCASCPRQKMAVRVQRLKEEYEQCLN